MKLRNGFKKEDVLRVWGEYLFCRLCGSNLMSSVHHIDGRSSSSIYNSIPLCDKCHKKADGHNTNSPLSTAFRKKLRDIAYNVVINSGHRNNNEDTDYLHKTSSS